jgi:hypothetical protein
MKVFISIINISVSIGGIKKEEKYGNHSMVDWKLTIKND